MSTVGKLPRTTDGGNKGHSVIRPVESLKPGKCYIGSVVQY